MKVIVAIISILAYSVGNSQEIKTYKGEFKDGIAEYSYKEVDYERINHGHFKYVIVVPKGVTGDEKNGEIDGLINETLTIEGNYENAHD